MRIPGGPAAPRSLEEDEQQYRRHAHPGEQLERIRISQYHGLPLNQAGQGLIGSRLGLVRSEPTTGQQALHLAQLLLLERINRTGTTVLMATHDHSIVDSMRRRVVELDLGRVVRDDARGVYGVGR